MALKKKCLSYSQRRRGGEQAKGNCKGCPKHANHGARRDNAKIREGLLVPIEGPQKDELKRDVAELAIWHHQKAQ